MDLNEYNMVVQQATKKAVKQFGKYSNAVQNSVDAKVMEFAKHYGFDNIEEVNKYIQQWQIYIILFYISQMTNVDCFDCDDYTEYCTNCS